MEKRFFQVRAQSSPDKSSPGKLVGYAAVFNELSDDLGGFREKIAPGAFRNALRTSDVRALLNHDANLVLGRTPETLRVLEDAHGLKVEIDLPDTQVARDLSTSVKRGDISQMSFGFNVKRDSWEDSDQKIATRTLEEIGELFDVAVVTYPAYKQTEINLRGKNMTNAEAELRQRIFVRDENADLEETVSADLVRQAFKGMDIRKKIDSLNPEERMAWLDKNGTNPADDGTPLASSQNTSMSSRSAFGRFIRSGDASGLEKRAMTIGTDSSGGYAIPTELDNSLQNEMHDASAMRQVCTVKLVTSAHHHKVVNLGGMASGWVGETDARPETTTPTLTEVEMPTGELYANPAVSQWMLDDTDFNLEDFIMGEIRGKFIADEGTAFISGNGTNKPKGILDYTSNTDPDASRTFGVLKHTVAASTSAITVDELLNTINDLRGVYRKGSVWMMNSSTQTVLRKLKDNDGRFLWEPSMAADAPNRLLGYPVYIDENVPDVAADAVPIMFGNFKKGYEILDRNTLMLRDPYSNKPYVHFYSTKRVSGMLVDSNAIRLMQMAAS